MTEPVDGKSGLDRSAAGAPGAAAPKAAAPKAAASREASPGENPSGTAVAASPRSVEPELLGGRLLLGIAMLFGIGVISWQWLNVWVDRGLHPRPPKAVAAWAVGSEADVQITLITADAKRLACAHDSEVEGVHCAYTANKRPWRRTPNAPLDDNDEHVIQPYRTADTNQLILVSGLWAEPELALRLHREPPNLADVDKHLRFVAYCRVRFVGEFTAIGTRWDTNAKWGEDAKSFVAKPVRCTLEPPKD
jgi:hypothetical protein